MNSVDRNLVQSGVMMDRYRQKNTIGVFQIRNHWYLNWIWKDMICYRHRGAICYISNFPMEMSIRYKTYIWLNAFIMCLIDDCSWSTLIWKFNQWISSLWYLLVRLAVVITQCKIMPHCIQWKNERLPMMTSSNGSIFCVTGPLCGEFTGHRWLPLTKASDAELDIFFDLPE